MNKIKTNGKEGKELIKKIILREREIILNSIKTTEYTLRTFESEHDMKSATFMKKYLDGQMGDDENYMIWAAQIQSLRKLKSDLTNLSGIKIVS